MTDDAILEVHDLRKTFKVRRGGKTHEVHAVNGVSLSVRRGETLGVVGESGCGKSTLARVLLGLTGADGGRVIFNGGNLLSRSRREMAETRLKIRMVFQDPYASLNPRRPVGNSVAETGDIHRLFRSRAERERLVGEALEQVGLGADFISSYPHELSGGQRQRVGIARAILPEPELVIADEPVSALDVSIQAQVLNLLAELKARLGLTLMFISHDLGVVARISDRVVVLYMGEVAEIGPARALFTTPRHPYTELLISAIPRPEPTRRITGAVEVSETPGRLGTWAGCPFQKRCPRATEICETTPPALREVEADRLVACHHG